MDRVRRVAAGAAALVAAAAVSAPVIAGPASAAATATPIQHLVVIYQENVSFDHYFGTYPNANGLGSAAPGGGTFLTNNPNKDAGGSQVNPRRLDPSNVNDVLTCDQGHNYNDEQKAFDGGAMDKFVTTVGSKSTSKSPEGSACSPTEVMNYYDGSTVTAYWNYAQHFAMSDNSFNSTFGPSSPGAINLVSGDTGGVDTSHTADPGGTAGNNPLTNGDTVGDGNGGTSLIEDAQPYYDDCSTRDAVAMGGQNIGDLLNAKGLSWGWFQGGNRPSTSFATANSTNGGTNHPTSTFVPDEFSGKFPVTNASNQGICNTVHAVGPAVGGTGQYGYKDDYIPHHEPFDYYASTANPHHLTIPTDGSGKDTLAGLQTIGSDTQSYVSGAPQWNTPNHQYDSSDFDQLVTAIGGGSLPASALPAVSFLKAPGYFDGHAAYSDPLDEQQFVAREINALEKTPAWSSTAVVITDDDSDGFYDHVYSGVHNTSNTSAGANPPGPQDFLTGTGLCGDTAANPPLAGQSGRCGYGARIPLLVISPYAKANFIDHGLTDQSSILRFAEDNWGLGRITASFDAKAGAINTMFDFSNSGSNAALFLDPTTGKVSAAVPVPSTGGASVSALLAGSALTVGGAALLAAGRRRRRGRSA